MNINIDFDGTCVAHDFPRIGKSIGAEKVLKELTDKGHNLILFTMRSDRDNLADTGDSEIQDVTGQFLQEAINWFKDNDIPLYGIQCDPNQRNWTTSPKSYAPLMIDDSALGCPLKYDKSVSDRPFADWYLIRNLLQNKGIL